MFLLFGGRTYYADGGWNDYQGSFETAEQAIIEGKSLMKQMEHDVFDVEWFHVVDFETGDIVLHEGDNYS